MDEISCEKKGAETIVKINNKVVGTIKEVKGSFQYFPKGQKTGGEIFDNLFKCIKSLEEE